MSATARGIGVVGIGAMGWPMAERLRERGWPVVVRDVRAEAEATALAAGLHVCGSPRELALHAELAIVVVADAAQIEAVLFAEDGLVAAGADGARTAMLCSTIAPDDTRRFAERLASHGIGTIDAPISGGPARARAGALSAMLAAPTTLLERWQPLLADLATHRFVIGETIGDAAKAKLVNNLIAGINLVAGAEGLALAEQLGLDPQVVYELVCASSGGSWVFEDRMPRALARDWSPPRAAARILTKDIGLATTLAAGIGQPTPLGDVALARFRDTLARGLGEWDDAAVIEGYRRAEKSR